MSSKRGFNVPEAAVYIGRSVSFLRRLKRENKIPAYTEPGGKNLTFLVEDLDAWLDSLEVA